MPGESVEAFLRCLHELAESCDFGEKEEENIRDRIIAGMSDKELSLKLQLEQLSTLTLSKTVEMARMRELVKTQVAPEVSHVTSQKHFLRGKPFKSRQPSRGPTSKDPKNKCPRCGYVHRSSMRVLLSMLNARSVVRPDISSRHRGVKGLSPINSRLNSHINSHLSSHIISRAVAPMSTR